MALFTYETIENIARDICDLCNLVCLLLIFCLGSSNFIFFRKLTLAEAMDVLDEGFELENRSYPQNVHALYIQPPDDELSGEDDADDDDGGIPDNLCASQLKAGCELVFENGQRIDYADDDDDIEITHINDEEVLASILNAPLFFVDDEPSKSADQPSTSKSPPRKRLCRVQATPSPVDLPQPNKKTTFVWEKDTSSSPIPIFPDSNYEDQCQPSVCYFRI